MIQLRRLLVLVALLATPLHIEAQSVFNSSGLGRAMEAVDGRGRAMGSVGIGLFGGSISPADPAAAAGIGFASAVMVAQPAWVEAEQDGIAAGTFRGTRFPLVGMAYPVLGGMSTVQFGSVLDQRFQNNRTVDVVLGGETYSVVDRFVQDGGVSSASLGYARNVGSNLAVGLSVGRYTGSVTRTLTRDSLNVDLPGAALFTTRGRWGYGGTSVTAGVSAQFQGVARFAGSVRWSSALEASASSGTAGGDRSYDLPLELRVGGSALLAPGLLLVASAVHADWSDVADDLVSPVAVGDASGFGVGLELSNFRLLGRSAPLRVGYRYSGLPFGVGTETASESAFTGGLGFAFNETNGILLAGVDLAIERGERSAGSLIERFWRATAAVRVSGF